MGFTKALLKHPRYTSLNEDERGISKGLFKLVALKPKNLPGTKLFPVPKFAAVLCALIKLIVSATKIILR